MHQPRTSHPMSSRLFRSLGPFLLFCAGGVGAVAQDPLTLRQAINQALGQNPEAAIARACNQDAKAAAALARTALLPQLGFTEDIARGNDPVYVFGSKLRQGQFTLADFAVNALNRPQPMGNFSTKLSGSWMAFDSFKTKKEIRRADLFKASAASSAKAVDQQIVFRVVGAYQSVLYAQREIDVAQHEQETAAALLASVAQPIGNFSTKLSGSWMAFDSFKTKKEIRRADLFKASAASSAKAVDQQIVFRVVGAY